MPKAIIQMGYTKYVVAAEDALKIMDIITGAERFEAKWHKEEEGGTTYHVWDNDTTALESLEIIPDNLYRMAKLAGKHVDK
jgi:hypothetical protein